MTKYFVEYKKKYFSSKEIAQFKDGELFNMHEKFGAHLLRFQGKTGVYFALWAPHALRVSVVGDFNQWNKDAHVLHLRDDSSGIWEGFIPDVNAGMLYKYFVVPCGRNKSKYKADPFAFCTEHAPRTASIVRDLKYEWQDDVWIKNRQKSNFAYQPISIYEVHLGSWRREKKEEFQTYREMADTLVSYVKEMGFTHVELMPIMEHPFYGSWGYQALGFFAPTSRYGSPEDLMYLIDCFHTRGIGVIFDWVVSHFPADDHGLANFDGTNLYEHEGLHPDWNSCIFNFARGEVRSFLLSNALFWIEKFHIDGFRMDGVASMLYLDYSRGDNWEPNFFKGVENLESVSFIRELNQTVKQRFPDVVMIAEESTAWPNVSRPVNKGGLHFDMKWNMGWMHDTLRYFSRPSREREKYYNELVFGLRYAFDENFVLAFSHDEVVYEKRSLIEKMPGSNKEKFASLRVLFGFMYAHPGKKLLFMGNEIAQRIEWNHDASLDWEALKHKKNKQVQRWVKDLNRLYVKEKALHKKDFSAKGFQWLDMGYDTPGVFAFLRSDGDENVLVICNFKNQIKKDYCVGVSSSGHWQELLNSDDKSYGGKDTAAVLLKTKKKKWIVKDYEYRDGQKKILMNDTLTLDVSGLNVIFLKKKG